MPTILVVANQTLGGDALMTRIREHAREGSCSCFVVVPATPPKEHFTWTEGEARTIAGERLASCLERLRAEGIEANGEVGDANPILAIDDATRHRTFDVILIATLPAGASRWLKLSLPDRAARKFGVPVEHVEVAVPSTV